MTTPESVPGLLLVDTDHLLSETGSASERFWFQLSRVGNAREGQAGSLPKKPMETTVLREVERRKHNGARVVFLSRSNETPEESIVVPGGLVDEWIHLKKDTATDISEELARLRELSGEPPMTLLSSTTPDPALVDLADRNITFCAEGAVPRRNEDADEPTTFLSPEKRGVKDYLKAIRPHQWLKNILVFLPMLTAHRLDQQVFIDSLIAFWAFSLVASGVYVLNDLLDLDADRAHPRKCRRPFASGAVPVSHGTPMALLLFCGGVVLAASAGLQFLLVLAGYIILTTAYSLHLKRRIVLDICVLAGLYTVRIIAGGAATGIPLSVWLLAFSIFFFFSLAAVKRQAELVDMTDRGATSAQGRGYQASDLNIVTMIAITSGFISVLVLALYLNSPTVVELYGQPAILWGICCILLFWVTRMVMVTHHGRMEDDPIVFATRDYVSQICLLFILAFVIAATFFNVPI